MLVLFGYGLKDTQESLVIGIKRVILFSLFIVHLIFKRIKSTSFPTTKEAEVREPGNEVAVKIRTGDVVLCRSVSLV